MRCFGLAAKPGGRPHSQNMQQVVNVVFYIVKAGCTWRLLPHHNPKWQTVYYYFRRWEADGMVTLPRRLEKSLAHTTWHSGRSNAPAP